jgi:hypothetical protein
VERVGNGVRPGQGHDHRRREPDIGPGAALGLLASAQLVRASAVASLRSEEAAARGLRRENAEPVTADEVSFTAAWRHAVRSMETSQVTGTSSLTAINAAYDSAARAHLHTLNIPDRDRHSPRVQKARPKFGHRSASKPTVTAKYQVIEYAPGRR